MRKLWFCLAERGLANFHPADHFYYIRTRWFADGDLHTYFNPYDSPHGAFIDYMNVLKDLQRRLERPESEGSTEPLQREGVLVA